MPKSSIPSLNERITAFSSLGYLLRCIIEEKELPADFREVIFEFELFKETIRAAGSNPWFTQYNVLYAIKSWSELLTKSSLQEWISRYDSYFETTNFHLKIAVVMAGNIPMVGMHDFITVLISGNFFYGKLSSNDKVLLPGLAKLLIAIEPAFASMIVFTEERLINFDAVIATGSNNTSRYFDYYFSEYPHIIRKNRNGVAIIDGSESPDEMDGLAYDICMYFGLGCRSVSKVFIPKGYDPLKILEACKPFNEKLFDHFKYMNNYLYQKTLLQMNFIPYHDNGVMLLVDSPAYSSPISVIHLESYDSISSLNSTLESDKERVQCIASCSSSISGAIPLGSTQKPLLWDYADGIDTIQFLLKLQK